MKKINLLLLAIKTIVLLFFLGVISTLIFAISPATNSQSQKLDQNELVQSSQQVSNRESNHVIDPVDAFNTDEIVFIESVDRYVNVHLADGRKKFIGKSFKKVADQFPFFIAVRGKASKDLGSKISVNSSFACYDKLAQKVNVDVWHKSIQPSENLKALVSYSLDDCK